MHSFGAQNPDDVSNLERFVELRSRDFLLTMPSYAPAERRRNGNTLQLFMLKLHTSAKMGSHAKHDHQKMRHVTHPLPSQAVSIPCRKGLAFWSYMRSCSAPM